MDLQKAFLEFREKAEQRALPSNTHLYGEYLTVYVRRSRRVFEGQLEWCIDVGTIGLVNEARDTGKGYFREFMQWLELNTNTRYLLIESVLNPKLEVILEKNGYTKYNPEYSFYPYSWIKLVGPHGRSTEYQE